MSVKLWTILGGVATAVLMALGLFFQKLNGTRGGNVWITPYLALATLAYFPTFIIGNKVFAIGGRMSLYVPVTAASYLISMVVGRMYFAEPVSPLRWVGGVVIILGVTLVASG